MIQSYYVATPIKGVCKQHAIWGTEGNQSYPLVFLQRPKWIKDDVLWDKIVAGIRLDMPAFDLVNNDDNRPT